MPDTSRTLRIKYKVTLIYPMAETLLLLLFPPFFLGLDPYILTLNLYIVSVPNRSLRCSSKSLSNVSCLLFEVRVLRVVVNLWSFFSSVYFSYNFLSTVPSFF